MSVQLLTASFDDLPPRTAYDVWRLRQDVFVVAQPPHVVRRARGQVVEGGREQLDGHGGQPTNATG